MSQVSIIIPTYNRATLLKRAINSVLQQSFSDFELIVVDDASTDYTPEVVKKINDSRIKLIQHSKNKGASAARNTGIDLSKGKYIAFLDDDDEWLPEKIERQLAAFQTADIKIGLIYSGYSFVSPKNNNILKTVTPEHRGALYPLLLRRNFISTVTPLVKKDCFKIAGTFDETLPSCQDWDMWIRISKYFLIDFIPDPLAKIYVHGDQISANITPRILAREKLIEKYHSDLTKYPSAYAFLLKRLGILYCLNNDSHIAISYFFKSLKYKFFQKDCYSHIILSLFFSNLHRKRLEKNHITILDNIQFYF